MKQFFKNYFSRDTIISYFLLLGVMALLYQIPTGNPAFEPIEQMTNDFELSDFVFSQMQDENNQDVKDNIVLVNIGFLGRPELAQMINNINRYEPKVLGLDISFKKDKGDEVDKPLEEALSKVKNLVMVKELDVESFDPKKNEFTKAGGSHPKFTKNAIGAYANFYSNDDDGFRTVRKVSSKEMLNGKPIYPLGVQLAKVFAPKKVDKFLARENDVEIINYIGNSEKFTTLDVEQVFDPYANFELFEALKEEVGNVMIGEDSGIDWAQHVFELSQSDPEQYMKTLDSLSTSKDFAEKPLFQQVIHDPELLYAFSAARKIHESLENSIKDKIVIMGYVKLPPSKPDLTDIFFTPKNERYVGKTYPDMYGAVIHANIVAMILRESYINEMSDWLSWTLSLILGYLSFAFFTYIYRYYDQWYDGVTKLAQIGASLIILFTIVQVFNHYNYKIDVTVGIFLIVLGGDFMEIYYSLIKNSVNKLFKSKKS